MNWDSKLTNSTSIWHSRPYSLFSLRKRVYQEEDWQLPGFDLCTYWFQVRRMFALSLDIPKNFEEVEMVSWKWFPTHIEGVWKHGALQVRMNALMSDAESILVLFEITNKGTEAATGKMQLIGDENRSDTQIGLDPDFETTWINRFIHHEEGVYIEKLVQTATTYQGFVHMASVDRCLVQRHFYPHNFAFAFSPSIKMEHADMPSITEVGRKIWGLVTPFHLKSGATLAFQIGISLHWLGSKFPDERLRATLCERAKEISLFDYQLQLKESRIFWNNLLDNVPPPKGSNQIKEEWQKLYYHAWVCTYQNIAGAFDAGKKKFKYTTAFGAKVGLNASSPYTWETALAGFIISLADPKLGGEIISSVVDMTDDDGFMWGENMVYGTRTSLPVIEPFMLWDIYERTKDKALLEKNYEKLRKRTHWRYVHPSTFTGGISMRNVIYNYLSFYYLEKIARVLCRSEEEVMELCRFRKENYSIAHSFWLKGEKRFRSSFDDRTAEFNNTSVASNFIGFYKVFMPEQVPFLLDQLEREFMTPEGCYFLYDTSFGRPAENTGVKTMGQMLVGDAMSSEERQRLASKNVVAFKVANYLFFIPGLRDTGSTLVYKVVTKTLDGIAAAGDFYEDYLVRGAGGSLGPMEMFGAFAAIWCLNQVDMSGIK